DDMRLLAAECDHWPVHVQNALTAFAEQVVACGSVEDVEFAAVRRRSGELQISYYHSRMSPEMRLAEYLLAAVMKETPEPCRQLSFIRAMESKCRPETGWQPPNGMQSREFFDHLVHRGALQELPDGSVHCPIPSFRRYMIGLGEK
ncbi:MAG: hypothetical protein OXB95_14335, partial [Rhodobacteraceae bacterium]|nr:hypothetical protein [Paracoccaceae bacterium]